MVEKVLEYVKKYRMIEPGDTIVAGISGGADSVCLLFVLMEIREKIPFSIEAVHVNHMIRQDAAADGAFVEGLCKKQGIPFRLVEEKVRERAKAHGVSEEEEGRKVRYGAFEAALNGRKGRIAVAHNRNDRAETMLFNLFRGTGLTGASGIHPVNGKIIRPLLCLGREEIEKWLEDKELPFCQDSTNQEDLYTRNRIRHHILTYAEKEVCEGAVRNMNRAADQLLCAQEYIDRQSGAALERCLEEGFGKGRIVLKLPALFREDPYLRSCILYESVALAAGQKKDITAAHIESMEQLFGGQGNGEIHLPYDLIVYKKYDLGMIQRKDKEEKENISISKKPETYEISVPSNLFLPGIGKVEFTVFSRKDSQNIPEKTYTKWFDYDKITSSIMFRTRRPGDYLTINSRMGRKSLQDYFVNEKVPREVRDQIYVLAEGSHVIWIPGYRISEYYKIQENTRTVLQAVALEREG